MNNLERIKINMQNRGIFDEEIERLEKLAEDLIAIHGYTKDYWMQIFLNVL